MSKKTTPVWDQALCFRVLGYDNSDGTWSAHCLETDLVGIGNTPEKALENLIELTDMQISFAVFKKEPHLLNRPAPPQIFEIYLSLLASAMQEFTLTKKPQRNSMITHIPFPRIHSKVDFAHVSGKAI